MIDIEERLRIYGKAVMPHYPNDCCTKGADEIARLRAEVKWLRAALADHEAAVAALTAKAALEKTP